MCEICKLFLPRDKVIKHASEKHNLNFSHSVNKINLFTATCDTYNIPKLPYQYQLPENKTKPLPFTTIYEDGLACKYCSRRMRSIARMEKHIREHHKDNYHKHGVKNSYLTNIPIQRLFCKEECIISQYFEVNRLLVVGELKLSDPTQNNILQSITQHLLPKVPPLSHQGSIDDRELSSFQRVFKWQHLLKDILADQSGNQLALVSELKRMAGHQTTSAMNRLRLDLRRYLQTGTYIYEAFERSDLLGGHVLNGAMYRSNARQYVSIF